MFPSTIHSYDMSGPYVESEETDVSTPRDAAETMLPKSTGDSVRGQRRTVKDRTFTCSWANCQRVFGKLEHLQRHERSRMIISLNVPSTFHSRL